MKKPIFTGVCTALVTPFLGETLNTPMLRQLIRRQEQAGIDALVICGTTGESATLSDDEKIELFQSSREAVPENMAFLAGTGSNDTAHAVALSQAAEGCGADGLLVVSPYYNKATEDGLYRHYEAIAQAVNTAPQTTRAKLRGEFLAKARKYGADFTVDWTRLKVNRPEPQVVEFADPFIFEDERLAGLIDYITEHMHD